MGIFKIDADNFSWINGTEDDPNDLCLHGHVIVQIGDTMMEDVGTVSATALTRQTMDNHFQILWTEKDGIVDINFPMEEHESFSHAEEDLTFL